MKKTFDTETRTVTFTFEGGLTPVTLTLDSVTESVRTKAMYHGFMQKLGDAAAIPREKVAGGVVTEDMRRAEVAKVAEHFNGGGAWETRMAAAPATIPAVVELAKALGCTYDEAMARIVASSLAELKAA